MLGFIIRNLLLIYSLLICIEVSHFKSIHVTLNSRWSPSSLLTQASEFIWDYDSHLFWTFFDYSIRKCNSKSNSDEDKYHCVMSFAEEYLPTGAHNLLAFSLSLQYYSAKIEMYQQIAKERILNQNHFKSSQACPVFVEVNGKFVICDPKKVGTFRNISHSNLSSISQIYEFDHKFPIQSDIQSLHVILYGSFDYIITIHFHMEILKLIAENLISSYTFRHYITPESRITLLPLSGYGVELAIKSTEYKSVDDSMSNEELHSQENAESDLSGINFQILMKNKPELIEKLSQFELHQLKMLQDIPPLKPWQLQDLSLQACQYLLQNSNLTDDLLNKLVFISQYFPTNAKKLSQLNISPGLKTEIEYNQKIFSSNGLDEGETLLILNGVIYRDIDIFTLYKDFISEHKLFSYLFTLGIQIQDFEKILAISTKMDNANYALDTRNESVVFINDISRDSAYSYWSREITDILRPTFPGVIRQIRQNLFNFILFVNPADKSSLPYLQAASIIINQKSPIRIGFVLTPIQKDTSELLTFGFYYLVEKYSPMKAFKWLLSIHESNKDSLIEMANSEFLKLTGIILSSVEDEMKIKIKILQSYYLSTGLTETPVALLNGIKMDIQDTNPDSIISSIRNVIYTETGTIQRDVYFGRYKKGQDVYDYLMSRSNVVRRLSKLILYSDTRTLLLMSQSFIPESSWLDSEITDEMPPTSITQLLLNTIPYVYNPKFEFQTKPLTILIVADFSTHHGFELLKSALHFINGSSHSRLALIYNPNSTEIDSTDLNQLLMGLIYTQQQHKLLDILNTIIDFMSDDLSLTDDKISELFRILSTNIKSFKNDKLINFMNVADLPISIQNYKTFLTRVLKLSPSELAVISNGRIYGPFNVHTDFTYDDFVFLEQLTLDLYGKELKSIIDDYEFNTVGNSTLEHDYMSDVNFKSDPLMKLASILTLYNNKDRTDFNTNDLRTSYSHLQLKPRDINSSVYFNLKLFIDPISKDGQKLLGMVQILHQRFNIFLQIWFNPIQHHSQIPLNRFYTYVLDSEIKFDEEGNFITTSPCSEFIDIPETPLFTLSMDVPHQWMVEPMYSLYDLDNIHLQDVHNTLTAIYELSHILIEGHCSSHTVRQPVPGLQFILGTDSLQNQYDSLVMANLGYFQLKATPGVWKMKLREGKSRDIYSILSHFGTSGFDNDYTVYVHIEDFYGKLIQIYVDKRPGQELNNLLDSEDSPKTDPEDDDLSSFWEKISNAFLTQNEENVNLDNKSALQNVSTVINIFSIASGHLYERFLRIMMLSVLKNTNTPIKFWFLKNYLSPHFKQFIPHMSKFYSFQYEFVEYKWPQWLNSQSEKQRTIWGYKILFLDVLFPMDLKRIIFVDADQVVRTDLHALTVMDLEGAAYAYTPFCNSRKEMDGFRFWKQGYWRNVLYNREYHISALYVVDLLRFRKLGAGDRLRGQYQSLSHDPNSLANLDQDLPNSMIHSVPLYSLPREWLWCETWCSDVEKLAAKTIDLCNNPLTKEPKLQAAQRIIEEWSDYDNEIKLLLSNYTSLITPNTTIPPPPTTTTPTTTTTTPTTTPTTTTTTDTKGKSDTHSHTEL